MPYIHAISILSMGHSTTLFCPMDLCYNVVKTCIKSSQRNLRNFIRSNSLGSLSHTADRLLIYITYMWSSTMGDFVIRTLFFKKKENPNGCMGVIVSIKPCNC